MKRLVILISTFLLIAGLFAADTDNFDIVVTCSYLDVSLKESSDHGIDFETWNLGILAPGAAYSEMTGSDHIWVENGSNTPVDFSAHVNSPAPFACGYGTPTAWTAAASAGTDQFKLELGTGTSTTPPATYTTITSSSAPGDIYLLDATAGAGHELYSRFTVPTSTTDGCEHTISVNINIAVH